MAEQYEDRRFVIFNVSELSTIDFDQVFETSADTVRKSVNGTLTFVKYDLPMPSSVTALTSRSQEYTFSQIVPILATSAWTDSSIMIP
jgi:hypothetical protein